ncbi:hypothetical protein HPB51_028677 [Rhipicephalus microplus]|uniref:Uncharacterized protein n=1 Tax=Rhipicephalus microplus TaxID=6941 RepID=A0A9J6CWM5_RHIMP|nr:hypothetical protein HPB51_028677 [Rhipicephalus microplus]
MCASKVALSRTFRGRQCTVLATLIVDQYADTLGAQKLEYAQVLENKERRLEVRQATEMKALKSEHRTDIEVLRESLQQELQDVKPGSEEEQRKMHRILEIEHNLVANSQKAQKGQIEKMKEAHASAMEQLAVKRAQLNSTWPRRRLPPRK